jgi:hypothetical protein
LTAASIFVGIVTSALGLAYITYGKRQVKFVPIIAGLALCVYSYFLDGWAWQLAVGAVLAALPFVIDF